MCRLLVFCADFKAILTLFSEVIRNRCLSRMALITLFFFTIGDFRIQFSIYTKCPLHHVFLAREAG